MAIDLTIKRGDNRPPVVTQLLDENGDPIASGSITSVKFICKRIDESNGRLVPHVEQDASFVSTGVYQYQWSEGETDLIGVYVMEWEVKYTDNTVRTFPTNGYNMMRIVPDLGGEVPAA